MFLLWAKERFIAHLALNIVSGQKNRIQALGPNAGNRRGCCLNGVRSRGPESELRLGEEELEVLASMVSGH
jgi:hypothetical protein